MINTNFTFSEKPVMTEAESLRQHKVVASIDQLRTALQNLTEDYESYTKAYKSIEQYLDRFADIDCAYYVLRNFMNQWIMDTCREILAKSQYNGHLGIEDSLDKEDLDFNLQRIRVQNKRLDSALCGQSISDLPMASLVDITLRYFDMTQLFNTINSSVERFNKMVDIDAANSIGKSFGLLRLYDHFPNELVVTKQKGRFILETSNTSTYQCDRHERLSLLMNSLSAFEAESGVSGFYECIRETMNTESQFGKIERPPAQIKVDDGGTVKAQFFKMKIKFYLDPDIFEALIGYVKTYTDHRVKVITVR